MLQDHAFRIIFSEDEQFGVEFSEQFLCASVEDQTEQLKALLREKMALPVSGENISRAAAENEIAILLIETFLAKLRHGERIQKDTAIGLDFAALEMPLNTWD